MSGLVFWVRNVKDHQIDNVLHFILVIEFEASENQNLPLLRIDREFFEHFRVSIFEKLVNKI
jgi:hypothetical protein